MASSKVMTSSKSNTRKSDLPTIRRSCSSFSSSTKPEPVSMSTTTATESTLLDAQITLIETPNPNPPKTVDDVWREIVSGERKTCKQEQDDDDDEIMTLEDFLVKAGAVEEVQVDDMKMKEERLSLSGVRAKRHRSSSITNVLEPLDKAAQQRQRRMIKNRESAARSRERKQAYQVELESLAVRLEEENELLLKEKAERTKERFKQIMENVVPVVENRRPPRVLRRVRSLEW